MSFASLALLCLRVGVWGGLAVFGLERRRVVRRVSTDQFSKFRIEK